MKFGIGKNGNSVFSGYAPSFWYHNPAGGGIGDFLLRTVLRPVGFVYGYVARHRFGLYYPIPLSRPVVCIGNLVAGGAGKTPVAMAVTDLLIERGFNPHLLTRGYGGTERGPLQVAPNRDTPEDVGDEALLLVDKAPTWVSRNRALGAQAAIDTGANVVVMDDGFQNPVMYKDFSIVVIDGGVGFGNGLVMPAGPLRETVKFGLSRADAVVIVGDDKTGVRDRVAQLRPDVPVYAAQLTPDPDNPVLSGKNVFAFAGIGRPDKFRDSLIAAGAVLEGWGSYPDHYAYTEEDLRELVAAADQRGATIVTTGKDHVRLPESLRDRVERFNVTAVFDDAAGLVAGIEKSLAKYMVTKN